MYLPWTPARHICGLSLQRDIGWLVGLVIGWLVGLVIGWLVGLVYLVEDTDILL